MQRTPTSDSSGPASRAAREHASGMPVGRSLIRLLGFFALVGALMVGTHVLITLGLRQIKTSSFGVWNQLFGGRIGTDIIITGSSRAMVHYDPRIIQAATGRTTFNIGVNGSQTDMQLAVLEAYLQRNPKPALVIHNLDLYSFVTSREIVDPAQYVPYLQNDTIYAAIQRVYPDVWKWKYLPLYGYVVHDMRFSWLTGLKGLIGRHPKEDTYQGYVPRQMQWTGDFEKFRQKNPNGVSYAIEPEGVRDVEKLVEVCRRHGAKVLFVYSPEHIEMRSLQRNRTEVFEKFREICSRFQVPMWDYSDSPLCNDRVNFYNSQHLNAQGSKAFSTDIAQRLKAMGTQFEAEPAKNGPP